MHDSVEIYYFLILICNSSRESDEEDTCSAIQFCRFSVFSDFLRLKMTSKIQIIHNCVLILMLISNTRFINSSSLSISYIIIKCFHYRIYKKIRISHISISIFIQFACENIYMIYVGHQSAPNTNTRACGNHKKRNTQ